MPSFQYITRQHQLDLALAQLQAAPRLGVDTESSGYYTYESELCLIQLSAGGAHFVIDVLAGLDLDPLGQLLGKSENQKVLHSAVADLTVLRASLGWRIYNTFDTFLAARLLGHTACSLGALVAHYEGVELAKKHQKSDWKKRPLSESQLEYAHLDTVYLESLATRMEAGLAASGLTEEFQAELRYAEEKIEAPTPREYDQEYAWLKTPGALDLQPVERGMLKDIHRIREERARKENIAPFRIMTNDSMLRLIRRRPGSRKELAEGRFGHQAFINKDSARLLEALSNPRPITNNELPARPRRDRQEEAILRRLKRWRMMVAEARGLDSSLIISNRAIEELARRRPQSVAGIEALDLMNSWKLEHYGPKLLKALMAQGLELPEWVGTQPSGAAVVGGP